MTEPLSLYVTHAETTAHRIEELATRDPETALATLDAVVVIWQKSFNKMAEVYPVAFAQILRTQIADKRAKYPEQEAALTRLENGLNGVIAHPDDAANRTAALECIIELTQAGIRL